MIKLYCIIIKLFFIIFKRTVIVTNIVEKREYLTKMVLESKELLLLKWISLNNSSFLIQQIQISNEDLAQSNSSKNECFTTSENVSQNSTISLEKFDNIVLEEIRWSKRLASYNDYTLPLSVWGRQKIADLWKEISEALNGNYFT